MNMFDSIKFVYNIDDEMKNIISSIDLKLSKIKITSNQKRENLVIKSKVRSIHSSLSIEANSLSLFDVENINDNKSVVGKKDEIQEVKNAIELYNKIRKFNFRNEDDFLSAHKIMMIGFEDDNGKYRNHGEEISRNGKIIYQAPDSILVPSLMKSLFNNIKDFDINKIVLAALFHYYFVSIHPFTDGNGRMARFWVSLMLIEYNDNFEFIPIEEEIYLNQEQYYESINNSHDNGNANEFIKFMLYTIDSALSKVLNNSEFNLNEIQNKIIELIVNNKNITQNEIASILGKNVRTIKRSFKVLIDNNIIERIGSDKTGYWVVKNEGDR